MKRLLAAAIGVLALSSCVLAPLPAPLPAKITAEQLRQPERQIVVTFRDRGASLRAEAGASPRAYAEDPGYGGSVHSSATLQRIAADYVLAPIAGWRISSLGVYCVVYEAANAATAISTLERLRSDKRIESAAPMRTYATSLTAPDYDDPYFSLQTGLTAIRVPQAQKFSSGRGVRIAVIDTGADVKHPDLAAQVVSTRNFVDSDDAAFLQDRHGTAIAGIIAAASNNGIGIVGVAPAAELLVLKACWRDDDAQTAHCNTLTLAAALEAAIEEKARIINLSLVGPPDPLLARLIAVAVRRGIIVVGARTTDANASFPATLPGVVAVADSGDRFANVALLDSSAATLVAPGQDVLSLLPGGRYDYVSGASASTAMVSGVTALAMQRWRTVDARDLVALLVRTATSESNSAPLVDACAAVVSPEELPGCVSIPAIARILSRTH
jgi:subtilisin family serine protease